jgi:hypothetical protein
LPPPLLLSRSSSFTRPRVVAAIIIDGLDECEGQKAQQEILHLIKNSTQQQMPLRFIIASRPEAHIREVFDEDSFQGLYWAFNVESSLDDVRKYLIAEFTRIHREHTTMAAVLKPWPSEEVLDGLVRKSSGYFIYASTVIKFVDDKNFRPTQRLEAIESLTRIDFQSPFGPLDELYTQILSAVPHTPQLVSILRVIDNFNWRLSCDRIDELLGLETGDTALSLRGLHSVVTFRHDPGRSGFSHASFSDFLRDPSRSGNFYIGDSIGLAKLARLVFTELGYMYEDPIKNRNTPIALCVHTCLAAK